MDVILIITKVPVISTLLELRLMYIGNESKSYSLLHPDGCNSFDIICVRICYHSHTQTDGRTDDVKTIAPVADVGCKYNRVRI